MCSKSRKIVTFVLLVTFIAGVVGTAVAEPKKLMSASSTNTRQSYALKIGKSISSIQVDDEDNLADQSSMDDDGPLIQAV